MEHEIRISKLKKSLRKDEKFPYMIRDLKNINYLTGFTGSSATMIVCDKNSYFITDSRYVEYAKSMLPKNVNLVIQESDIFTAIKTVFSNLDKKFLYFQDHAVSMEFYKILKKSLRGIKLISADSKEVKDLRTIKYDIEIDKLKKAAEITDRCVDHLHKFIKPKMTEWEIATEIESFYKKNGCRRCSFDPIVASGHGSSMPHYETSICKKVEKGDILLIDMGCEYQGYNSDLTRTIFIETVDDELREIYEIVKEAQEAAIKAIKPGVTAGYVDSVARNIIEKHGYGEMFGHSLGHGVGLEIHEQPSIKDNSDVLIKIGMVFTVEPGIYKPGVGGVRIEDMICVTSRGAEVLTKSSKEITVI